MENTIAKRIDAIGFVRNADLSPRFDSLLATARRGGFVVVKMMTPEGTTYSQGTGTGRMTPATLRELLKQAAVWDSSETLLTFGYRETKSIPTGNWAVLKAKPTVTWTGRRFGIKMVEVTPMGDVLVTVWPVPASGPRFKPSPRKRK